MPSTVALAKLRLGLYTVLLFLSFILLIISSARYVRACASLKRWYTHHCLQLCRLSYTGHQRDETSLNGGKPFTGDFPCVLHNSLAKTRRRSLRRGALVHCTLNNDFRIIHVSF